MHIIVLGGNGFIGSHFVKHAVRAGHRVTVVDLMPTPRHRHAMTFEFWSGGTADLATDRDLLRSADVIVHGAYSTVPATANADPARDIADNLMPLVALLEAMDAVDLKRIVYLSSGGAVYGRPQMVPIAEHHPLDPISAYGVTKVASEKYLGMYAANRGLRPTVIRPANPYGIDQGRVGLLGAVTTFLNLLATGGTATIWGDGSVIRDFIHIDDLARLMLTAVEQDVPGIYNCGSGEGCSLIELVDTIAAVTGQRLPLRHEPARGFDPPEIVLDIEAARNAFGWQPRVSIEDGVRDVAGSLGLVSDAEVSATRSHSINRNR